MPFQWVSRKLVVMVGMVESWYTAVIIKTNKDTPILRLILDMNPAETTVS